MDKERMGPRRQHEHGDHDANDVADADFKNAVESID
jgi:hypothetical protein